MPKKILIIDDDHNIAMLLRELFTSEGYEVKNAGDAYSSMPVALAFRPDLIILDMNMPAGGGGTVFSRLRENSFFSQTPILISSSLKKEEAEKNLPPGAVYQGYLQKPADLDALIQKVSGIIGKP